jgi:two-component system response regulator
MRERAEILLVEDNPHDVELTLHAFEKAHLAQYVHVVRDGAEALDYLFCKGQHAQRRVEDKPTLLLLDLKMPKVSGLEVLRQIKADPLTRSIPVVALTSSRHDRDVFLAYDLGVNSYVLKPVDFQQFSDVTLQLGLYWLVLNEPPRVGPSTAS